MEDGNMIKVLFVSAITIALIALLMLPLQAEGQSLIIKAAVQHSNGIYTFTFDSIIPANLVELTYLSQTIILTDSTNLIDLSRANFTATELCHVYGSAQTIGYTEDGIMIASFIDIVVQTFSVPFILRLPFGIFQPTS